MGLVKTRRLAAMQKQQRAKAGEGRHLRTRYVCCSRSSGDMRHYVGNRMTWEIVVHRIFGGGLSCQRVSGLYRLCSGNFFAFECLTTCIQ